MANENRCLKCDTELHEIEVTRDVLRPYTQDEWDEVTTYEMLCPLDPKDCRNKELESLLGASEARERELQGKYQFMVDRAADEKLDGYREIGARAAQAENALDAHKAFHFAVGKAMGMMFEADGRADEPAPMAELVDAIKRLKSERDAALAQVGVLRSVLKMAWHFVGDKGLSAGDRLAVNCDIDRALEATSATAQQFVERIEREVLEAFCVEIGASKEAQEADKWVEAPAHGIRLDLKNLMEARHPSTRKEPS